MSEAPRPTLKDNSPGDDPSPPRVRPRLRRPTDQLAGCMWLPRLVDKTRLHLAGTLPADYILPFCHPLAMDGAFLTHFAIAKEELVAAVRDAADQDDLVAAWFLRGKACTSEKIQAWNDLAPDLGKPGFPLHRGFKLMLRTYYAGQTPDPRVEGVFTAIAYDEGFLDEVAPRPEVDSLRKPGTSPRPESSHPSSP